jgi:hypothetical protein
MISTEKLWRFLKISVHSLHKAHGDVVSFRFSEATLLQDYNEILILDKNNR